MTLPHRWHLINKLQMWNYEVFGCKAGFKTGETLKKSLEPRCQAVHPHMWVLLLFPTPWLLSRLWGPFETISNHSVMHWIFRVLQMVPVAQILQETELN